MGGVCGVAVESQAVRLSYFRDGQRVEDSIDAEGAAWLLSGKLVDCGPFDDVVLTGRDSDVVESLLASLDTGNSATIRVVDEGAALLAYAKSVDELAQARSLLVLDLGRTGTSAFTLDVPNGVVTRSARRAALSGESLDDVVERLVMDKGILPPAQGPDAIAEYRAFFRELKELISASAGVRAPGNGPMLLTRAEFDDAVTSTFLQTLAWAAPKDPDAVLLIGGGARIPLFGALVEQEWTVPLVVPDSPGSVILEGAALEATPTAPHLDLSEVLSGDGVLSGDEVLSADEVIARDGDPADVQTEQFPAAPPRPEVEPPTTPMAVVAPAATSAATPAASSTAAPAVAPDHAVPEPAQTERVGTERVGTERVGTERVGTEPAEAEGRRFRWSVRDAAGLVGVGLVVLLVWAVVFLRGDTPPPPGIGVEPAGTPTMESSVAEGVPVLPTVAPAPADIPEPDRTGDPDSSGDSIGGDGFDAGTGSDAGN